MFDSRELQRWGVPESRLPPGSVVSYRGPSLWREYRATIGSAAAILALQALLIIGLLFERRARQRAEIESRRNLALAADVSRRATMSALTSSIAHELAHNPSAGSCTTPRPFRRWSGPIGRRRTRFGEVLTDIQTDGMRAKQIIERQRTMLRSHELQRKPIDLHAVVRESLAARCP
jgi:hypothetical protein